MNKRYTRAWSWICDNLKEIDGREVIKFAIVKNNYRNKWNLSIVCGCLDDDSDDDGCDYEFEGDTQDRVIMKAIDYLVMRGLVSKVELYHM